MKTRTRGGLVVALVLMAVPITVAETETAVADAPAPRTSVPSLPALTVELSDAVPLGSFRWSTETAALTTALMEAGLAELRGVLPRVNDRPVPPGLAQAIVAPDNTWTMSLELSGDEAEIAYFSVLCDPAGVCTEHRVSATRTSPDVAVAALLRQISGTLGRAPTGTALAPVTASDDEYALVIAGRSAATGYGLRPQVSPNKRGRVRYDPVVRAPYIDPEQPVAWNESGRQQSDPVKRWIAFSRQVQYAPTSVLANANEAMLLEELDRCEEAWDRWVTVDSLSPGDLRFAVPRARAALCAGDKEAGRAIVSELSEQYDGQAAVARLKVDLQDIMAPDQDRDALLADWQDAAPQDPEPVRRRIRIRLDNGQWAEALEMTNALSMRGEDEEAQQLAMALRANLDQWAAAAQDARAIGLHETAELLATRAGLDSAQELPALRWNSPTRAHLAHAQRLLEDDAGAALDAVDRILKRDPWLPEAMYLRYEALQALDRDAEAAQTRRWLELTDPAFFDQRG